MSKKPRRSSQPRTLKRLFDAQNKLCCYCDGPTWIAGGETRVDRNARLGVVDGPGAGKLLAAMMATREHVKRRVDGGGNADNLMMACGYCNTTRHGSEPDVHRVDMQVLVAAGLHPTNRPRIVDSPRDHIKRGLKALKKLRAGKPIT